MQLYFIRHGQSINNLIWDQMGSSKKRVSDPELTHFGQQQAQAVAQFLGQNSWPEASTYEASLHNVDGFAITHLYSSPMIRCMDTAAPIAQSLKLKPKVWIDIHEQGGACLRNKITGVLEGLPGNTRTYLAERYPQFELPDALDDQGWWNKEAEDWSRCYIRAGRVLKALEDKHGHSRDRVALVSHGAFYNACLGNLLGMPADARFWFTLNNVAVTRIDFQEDETRLAYLNRIDFLPPSLVT